MDGRERDEAFEAELRRRLGPRPEPRPGYAEELRGRFLRGSRPEVSERSSAPPMLEDALRRLAPPPAAREEFRVALRDRFVGTPAPGREPAPAPLRPLSTGPLSWQVGLGLLAAAAAVALLVLGTRDGAPPDPAAPGRADDRLAAPETAPQATPAPEPVSAQPVAAVRDEPQGGLEEPQPPIVAERRPEPLEVTPAAWRVRSAGRVLLDGEPVGRCDLDELSRRLNGASCVDSQDDELVLELHGDVQLALVPHTRLELAAKRRTCSRGEVGLSLECGGLLMGPVSGQGRSRLLVETPHAVVRIAGNLLGIDVFEEGTCICVASGDAEVEVLFAEHQTVRVGPDSTCFVFADGGELKTGPSSRLVGEGHLHNLHAFRDGEPRQY